jgi:peptide/nickel transport system permease protein
MTSYLLRRLAASCIVIFGVVTIVFVVVRAVPGDPVASILGEQALEVDKRRLRQCMDLAHPETVCIGRGRAPHSFARGAELVEMQVGCPSNPEGLQLTLSTPTSTWSQYRHFWGDVLDGSLGELCGERGVTVADKLTANIPATFRLALASILVAILIGIPLGVLAALRPYSWIDNASAFLALLGISIPNFWLGPMLLILFSLTLQVLPNPGAEVTGLSALVLPAITLGSALSAKLMRMMRSSMLEILHLDYIRTARAKGLARWKVLVKHALRNALIPIVTILGLQFGALLTGAIIVEKIFARPGVGTLLLEGIQKRNYMIVQGCVLFISMTYVVVNLLTDLIYGWIDPRIRYD